MKKPKLKVIAPLKKQLLNLRKAMHQQQLSQKKQNESYLRLVKDIRWLEHRIKNYQLIVDARQRAVKDTEGSIAAHEKRADIEMNESLLNTLHKQRQEAINALEHLPTLENLQLEIEVQKARKGHVESQLEILNTTIANSKTQISQLEDEQRSERLLSLEKAAAKKIELKNKKIVSPSQPQDTLAIKTYKREEPVLLIEMDWKDVAFHDGSINFRFANYWSAPYYQKDSRASFNAIKAIYKFRNAPKLKLKIQGRAVLEIINQEVLTYYLNFLEIAQDVSADRLSLPNAPAQKLSGYLKAHFHKHLPQLFSTDCFNKLCEVTSETLPIIPVPELVISSSGHRIVHDSFLFPVVSNNSVRLIWESVETSKATYIFQFPVNQFSEKTQLIFDYLCGHSINKRSTITTDKSAAALLSFQTKVYHKDYMQWETDLFP